MKEQKVMFVDNNLRVGNRCDVIYYSPHPEKTSHNGLYVITAGETMPGASYYHERPQDFWAKKGGVYVIEHVLEGKGYIECDGNKYTVEAGDFYMLTRFHAHKYYADPDRPFRKIWVNLYGPLMTSLADGLGLTDGVYIMHHDSSKRIEQIHSLLKSFNVLPKEHVFDNIALIVTDIMLSVNLQQKAVLNKNSSIIAEIKRYIDSEANIGANLDDICLQFSVSKSYTTAVFKKTYGITLYQYMLEKKIKTARSMLENGIKINNVSDLLGYSCSQSFTHAFKKIVGVSPNAYRDAKMDKNDDEHMI